MLRPNLMLIGALAAGIAMGLAACAADEPDGEAQPAEPEGDVEVAGDGDPPTDTDEAETIVWRVSTPIPENTVQASADLEQWASEVADQSDGRLEIEVHYGGSLVPVPEELDAMNSGVIDGAAIILGVWPEQFSIWNEFGGVHDLDDSLALSAAEQSEITWHMIEQFPEMEEQLADQGLRLVFLNVNPPYAIQSASPIRTMDELQGSRIRTFGTGIPRTFERGGAVPVDMPFGEVYSATQTGAVDGTFTALDSILGLSYYEVAPYITLVGDQGSTAAMGPGLITVVSERSWNDLPTDLQNIVRDAGQAAEQWLVDNTAARHQEVLDATIDAGGEVYDFAEINEWRDTLGDLYDEAADRLEESGYSGHEMLDELMGIIEEVREREGI